MNKKEIASTLFPKYSGFIAAMNMNAKMRKWINQNDTGCKFNTREEIYRHVASTLTEDTCITFLEFGVFEGSSLEMISRCNTHPDSRFIGFDTFEGLPEDWNSGWGIIEKGSYTTDGILPDIDDSRVRCIKGYYQDVLDEFLATFNPAGQLVVHVDCDLYSSSLYVLTMLDRLRGIKPLILMDDFSSPNHMFRAFDDYTSAYRVDYTYVASSGEYYDQVCVQLS
jgi:O-methyltransferase